MRRFMLLIGLALLSCSSSKPRIEFGASEGPDWPTPRANSANTGRVAPSLPNPPYRVLWSVKTGGVAASEPVVLNGILFFSGLDRRVEVYDLATGERLSRKRFDGPVLGVIASDSTLGVLTDQDERRFITLDLKTGDALSSYRLHSASAPPRRLDDSTIVFGAWTGHLLAMTSAGRILWDAECDGPIKSAPALDDSIVYVSSGRSVFALRAINGSKLWEYGTHSAIEGAPALDHFIYFGAVDSMVTALDPVTGTLVWSTKLPGGVFTTPAVGDSFLFVASNDGTVAALARSNGAIVWTFPTSVVANLSPTLCGEYLLTTSRNSVLTMLRATTGEVLWSDKSLTGQATTSPVVVGDRIILTDSDRRLVCLSAVDSTNSAASTVY